MRSSPLRHPARAAGASLLRLQSDERLAELAVGGHDAAFDAIVDRYRTPLQRYCTGIVGPSRAEDAVQQTLINAHDALKRTDEVRHLRSWLYRIAHNTSLNVLRAVRDDASLDDAADPAIAALAADGDAPDAAFERSERFRATVEALRELPERQRAALVLRELEGRSHEEIADALGVTKGSARQHLLRARIAMRAAVTAITPYPLVMRLAEALGGSGGAGWADAAAGAGVGVALAKLTAGVVATGALVGGAVQIEHAVHHGSATAADAPKAAKGSLVRGRAVKLPATISGAAAGSGGAGSATSGSSAAGDDDRSSGRGRGRDDGRSGTHDGQDESHGGGAGGDSSGEGSSGSRGGGKGSGHDGSSSSGAGRGSGDDKSDSKSSSDKGSRKGSPRSRRRSSGSRKGSSRSGKSDDDAALAGTTRTPSTTSTLSTSSDSSGSDGSRSSGDGSSSSGSSDATTSTDDGSPHSGFGHDD